MLVSQFNNETEPLVSLIQSLSGLSLGPLEDWVSLLRQDLPQGR